MIAETQFLKAKAYPAGVQYDFTWWSQSDDFVVQKHELGNHHDSLRVYALKEGTVDIILQEAYSGLEDTCHVTVTDEIVPVENISFDNVTFDLYEGQANYLFATTYPNYTTDSLLWSSENSDIARVGNDYFWATESGGLAHTVYTYAIKPGSTNIVATTKDGKVTAKYCLAVKGITDIKLNKSEIELYDGKMETLNVTVLPDGATAENIKWTTENEEIATVFSRGKGSLYEPFKVCITGGRPGETSVIGTSYDGKVVVKCKVTVKNNNQIEYHPYDDDTQW